MNPSGQYPFNLLSIDAAGKQVIGKKCGIDGKPFLRIDGPHAAPCQHHQDYNATIVVGAGIGLTPLSSILRGTVLYKWKKGFGPHSLYFGWVVRHSDIMSYQWFIHLLQQINQKIAQDRECGSLGPENHLEVHVFVTGYSKSNPLQPAADDALEEGIETLLHAVLNPTVESKSFGSAITNAHSSPNRFGDLWVWNGRPDWDQYFSHVRDRHVRKVDNIGVCYCGPPLIGKDMKRMCEKHSSAPNNLFFTLHKENF